VQRLEINPEHPEPYRIRQAVARLEAGQAIIYPTDTLYGLGADMRSSSAVQKLYTMRRLDPRKPLSLICGSLTAVSEFATFDNQCFRFMKRNLPGPYTFVLNATRNAPRMGQTKRRTVGIRVPDHPVTQAIVEQLGHPFLSTSVMEESDVAQDPVDIATLYAHHDVGLLLDAGLLPSRSSTVIDWTEATPQVIREGAGSIEDLV
jgi:tRNA threonylcarbamoyl adenosine modification protein (Sua5/YciO/YrdC/YwlC family)